MNIVHAIIQALQHSGVDPEGIQRLSATRMNPLLSVDESGWSIEYSTAAMLEIDPGFERIDLTDRGSIQTIEML